MNPSFFTDEHVPRVFITTLRSDGYTVVRARDEFREATDDEELLRHCGETGYVVVTHDKKDFAGEIGDSIDHSGIIVYTDANYLRDRPADAVRTIERVFRYYSPPELTNEIIRLDQWRD